MRQPIKSALIRPATAADLPALIAIERSSETASHWPQLEYEKLFQPGADSVVRLALVAEEIRHEFSQQHSATSSQANKIIRGFLVARHVALEWELENIVVAPEARRTGLGTKLLAALFATARGSDNQSVFLEVRESNAAARALYEKAGFQLTAQRKSYYADPQEDAAVYKLALGLKSFSQ